MFTVSDLYQMSILRSVKVLTGKSGFSRSVRNVGVLDYEYISAKIQEEFLPDDLVLSSFLSLRDRPELVSDAIRALIDIGVSCAGIKKVYLMNLPEELIKYAEEKDFSIFLFEEEISFESIIIAVFDNLKSQEEGERDEERLNKLVELNESPEEARRIALEINPEFYETAAVLYLRGSHRPLAEELGLLCQVMREREERDPICWKFCFYRLGAALILTYEGAEEEFQLLIDLLIRRFLVELEEAKLGVSNIIKDLGELGCALSEAFYAYEFARTFGKAISLFQEIGPYRVILPLAKSAWGKSYCDEVLGGLIRCARCDRKKNAVLLETLIAFVHCERQVKRTAKQLEQHENTVRYRIKRVYDLLGLREGHEADWLELSMAVYLYEMIRMEANGADQ